MYVYELRYDKKSRYMMYHESLASSGVSETLPHSVHSSDFSCFLVDESWFHMLSFDHEIDYTDKDKAFGAGDFYALCDEDYNHYLTQLDQFPAQQLGFFVDEITVDGDPTSFLLGQHGVISFHLLLLFMQYQLYDRIKSATHKNQCMMLPSSLPTIHYIKSKFEHKRFVLLYLYDDFAKLVSVVDGTYHKVTTINLGKRKLIAMIEEAGLTELFQVIESGDVLHTNLTYSLEEVYLFYIKQLIEWVQGETGGCDVLFLVGGGLSYPFFTQLFHREFSQQLSAFLIPLHLGFVQNFHGDAIMTDLLCLQHFYDYFQKNYHQLS